jgi:glycosyltransferase involved in cell wall biosynthesis
MVSGCGNIEGWCFHMIFPLTIGKPYRENEETRQCKLAVRMKSTRSLDQKLRIAIDCRINDFRQGIGTAVQALAKALSDSDNREQEYTFIVRESQRHCLMPYVYGPCRLEAISDSKVSGIKAVLRWIAPLRFLWRIVRDATSRIPDSDGYVESRCFDIVHFPTQVAYLTKLPSIYQPWDLQHLHYPDFFSKAEFARREREYRAFCEQAACVCVQAEWTEQDVIRHYGLAKEKLEVIPWGPVFDAYQEPSEEECQSTIEKYALPICFFFYPAVTWPHKNHEVILRALHVLKKKDELVPHVYFTGASTEYRSTLETLAQELGISEQVHYLGFVTPTELQAIFRVATSMIFPSKFEGFGLPILEAFHARLPVLSSNASTLPEVARDGALYFDPDSPAELCGLMKDILDSPELRQKLIVKGSLALSRYSMDQAAASFQALYARTAALALQNNR